VKYVGLIICEGENAGVRGFNPPAASGVSPPAPGREAACLVGDDTIDAAGMTFARRARRRIRRSERAYRPAGTEASARGLTAQTIGDSHAALTLCKKAC
jgi:hypothetical protein